MNRPYQSNYDDVTAIAMPMEQSFFPKSLEQRLYDGASNILQKGRDYWTHVKSAFDTIDYYQTTIADYILEKGGIILFSKRGRELKNRGRRKELDKKRTEKKQRMENPSGGSRYAKKH